MRPALLTFDVFGTVLDWRAGLTAAVRAKTGATLTSEQFEAVIDAQGEDEQATPGRRYRDIVAASLERVLGMAPDAAAEIGEGAGRWPLFPDSLAGMRRLLAVAPCAAMTNSDVRHGEQVRAQLGFSLTHWVSAEEVGAYKPSRAFWTAAASRAGVAPGPAWWHVSAYADYDLGVARELGLTCVFVTRPHSRAPAAGIAHHTVADVGELATVVEGLAP